jgi:hypothetical protein
VFRVEYYKRIGLSHDCTAILNYRTSCHFLVFCNFFTTSSFQSTVVHLASRKVFIATENWCCKSTETAWYEFVLLRCTPGTAVMLDGIGGQMNSDTSTYVIGIHFVSAQPSALFGRSPLQVTTVR